MPLYSEQLTLTGFDYRNAQSVTFNFAFYKVDSFTIYTLYQNLMNFTEQNQLYSYLIDILFHFNRNIGQTLVRVIIKITSLHYTFLQINTTTYFTTISVVDEAIFLNAFQFSNPIIIKHLDHCVNYHNIYTNHHFVLVQSITLQI